MKHDNLKIAGITMNANIRTGFINVSPTTERIIQNWLEQMGFVSDSGKAESAMLSIKLSEKFASRLGSQGFELTWRPEGEMNDLFDPNFRWHGETGSIDVALEFPDPPNCGTITSAGEAGLLYGVREFIERCDVRQCLPIRPLEIRRKPALELRTSCLQLMKKGQYILPITQERFPWFFDRAWWTRYLDFLLEHRFNAVTLWNFHPFPYFCQIEGHPEVSELPEEQRDFNAAHLRWVIAEAGARGIKLLWHFYNIYVCPSYAKAHGLNTLHSHFTPQQEKGIFGYIRNSVRSFANAFPEVGFVACVGEGVRAGKAERFVADVLVEALNETAHHPPLVVRQWSSLSADQFERDVVGKYDSLWAMIKHNAEHIAGTVPDARVSDWVATGVPVIVNMHMLSEIGPFRWAPPGYIREMCLLYKAIGARGVHVYPHWPWRTPDVGDIDFEGDELDRDWLYHSAWGRYGFDPVRDGDAETRHWVRSFRRKGLPRKVAETLVSAYETSGPALPRIQQHLWVYYDNHSVLPAGLTLGQLSFARSMHGRNIIMTDQQEDVLPLRSELLGRGRGAEDFCFDQAVAQSLKELDHAIENMETVEFAEHTEPTRLHSDLQLMRQAVEYLRRKSQIAGLLMRFDREGEINLLRQAAKELRESLDFYSDYRYQAERWYEGISDVPPYFPFKSYRSVTLPYTWSDCLEVFERELANIEVFHDSVKHNEPLSLVHHFGFDRVDARRELESELIQSGGRWLAGDPDFIPWSRHIDKIQNIILLPCALEGYPEISVLSDLKLLGKWIEDGGQLTALTLPDLPWAEVKVLAGILGTDVETLNPQIIEHNNDRFLTINASDSWEWNRRLDYRGIRGHVIMGKGRVEFIALASTSTGNFVNGAGFPADPFRTNTFKGISNTPHK